MQSRLDWYSSPTSAAPFPAPFWYVALLAWPDPRDSGSGNPGATNVLRIGGKGAAVAVLIFDVLKGMLPVWGAWALGLTPFWLGLVAIAACVGHIWPVFFHFRGGKGVATAFGAIAPIGLDLTGVMAGTWLLTILLSGYSSLGAIVSALIAPFYVWWFKPQYTFPVSMLSCLILLRHHDNIQRLWRRQESKIWTRVKKKKRQSRSNLPSRLRQPGNSPALIAPFIRPFTPPRHQRRSSPPPPFVTIR